MRRPVAVDAVFQSQAYNKGVQELSLNPPVFPHPPFPEDVMFQGFLLATQGQDMSHCSSCV